MPLHPPAVGVYSTVAPAGLLQIPTTSFLIPFSHASYSSLCKMIHFSFGLDTGKGAKSPDRLLPVPSEISILAVGAAAAAAVDISEELKPLCSVVNLHWRSQMGLSAGWVMGPIGFFVSNHQHFIFLNLGVPLSRFTIRTHAARPLGSVIRYRDAEIMEGNKWD